MGCTKATPYVMVVTVAAKRFYCSAKSSSCRSRAKRPHPEHSHGARASPHAPGDLVVREPLDVAQEDDLGIISREPGHCIGQAKFELVAAGALAGGRVWRREQIAQSARRLGQGLLQ